MDSNDNGEIQKMNTRVSIGTNSKSVSQHHITICEKIRPILYRLLGVSWPFRYDKEKKGFHVLDKKRLEDFKDSEFERMSLSLGPCLDTNDSGNPVITKRFIGLKTSQGKVVLANGVLVFESPNLSVNAENAEIVVIVKVNHISQKNLWLGYREAFNLKIKRGSETKSYRIIGKSYMDSLCSIMFSRLVEKGLTPHFPICYSTHVNKVEFKKDETMSGYETRDGPELCQTIWMEYLPLSMWEALKNVSDAQVWWSALFQATAGLCEGQARYGLVHNDFHSENVRVRVVPESAVLYYQTKNGVYLRVPTFGYVFVIIDFGRVFFKPWGNGLVSSVFGPKGECKRFRCDNPSYDLVRLVTSLDDTIGVISDKEEREKIKSFFKHSGQDILEELWKKGNENKFSELLEDTPRKHCHQAIPSAVLTWMYDRYKVDSIPEGIKPYPLHVN